MRIIDNYIFRSIISIFFSAMLIFLLLTVLIDAANNMDDFLKNELPLSVILKYYGSFLPIVFVHTAPIACLLACLITYSGLNAHNEIIALRAAGLDFWQITKPALCFGLIISAFVFLVNERYVPKSSMTNEEIKENQIKVNPQFNDERTKADIRYLTFYGLKNRLFFIDKFNPNDFTLEGITIVGQDNQQRITEKIAAFRGEWTGIAWKFHNCQITEYDLDDPDNPADLKFFREKLMNIKETPEDFLKQRLDVNSMNMLQLKDYIKRFASSGAQSALTNLKVDFHQKISNPFGSFVIILVGLPFALTTGRRKAMTFTSIGIAIAIGFLFYVTNAVGLALGKGGAVAPIISAWLAPAIFLIAAVVLIRKLN